MFKAEETCSKFQWSSMLRSPLVHLHELIVSEDTNSYILGKNHSRIYEQSGATAVHGSQSVEHVFPPTAMRAVSYPEPSQRL